MSVFSINTQPKNAFNLEAAAKHGDLRSMKRIKNIVLNKNKACYWNAKCKFRCLINLFDHRETCCEPAATLGYEAFGGKIVYNLRWVGRGNYFILRDLRIFQTNLSRKKSLKFKVWILNAWHSKAFKNYYPWYLSYSWHDYVAVQFSVSV